MTQPGQNVLGVNFLLTDFEDIQVVSGGLQYIYSLIRLVEPYFPIAIIANHVPFWMDDELECYVTTQKIPGVVIVPECVYKKYHGQNVTIPLFQGFAMADELKYAITPSLTTSPFMRGILYAKGIKSFYLPLMIDGFNPTKSINSVKKEKIFYPKIDDFKNPFLVENTHTQRLSREAFNQRLIESEAMVYSSSIEGFGLPVLEAMAAGCVVFSGDTLGNTGFVRDGYNGFIIRSPQEWRDKYAYFANLTSKEKKTIANNAIKTAELYYPKNVVAEIVNTLKEVNEYLRPYVH